MGVPEASSSDCRHTPYAALLDLSDERVMRELPAANTDAFAVIFKRYHRLVYVESVGLGFNHVPNVPAHSLEKAA